MKPQTHAFVYWFYIIQFTISNISKICDDMTRNGIVNKAPHILIFECKLFITDYSYMSLIFVTVGLKCVV